MINGCQGRTREVKEGLGWCQRRPRYIKRGLGRSIEFKKSSKVDKRIQGRTKEVKGNKRRTREDTGGQGRSRNINGR